MNFEYYFDKHGKLTSKGDSSLYVICFYNPVYFYIESAEGYIQALDIWKDVTEDFKTRDTMVQAVLDRAAEDYSDAQLPQAESDYDKNWMED